MERVAILSDSHIPERASGIPDAFEDRIRDADHVVHAGDFTTAEVMERVKALAQGSVTFVTGNMDPPTLALPETVALDVEAVTFVVTHGTGDLEGYERRVAGIVRETADASAVGIAGHTHAVLDAVVEGVRILNPGSVTGAPPASRTTMMTASVEDSDLEVTVHEAPT